MPTGPEQCPGVAHATEERRPAEPAQAIGESEAARPTPELLRPLDEYAAVAEGRF